MSKSSLATEIYPAYAGNYTQGRSGRKIEAITIHHMAGKLTARQCGSIFQTVGRNGSSHYGIGYEGEIACYVEEENTAWTNSNWDSNCKSVTIETANNINGGNWSVSDKSLNSLIKLVADIGKRNNLGTLIKGKNVTWHSMFANTTCPGEYLLSKMDYIIAEANKINSTPAPTKSVDELAREVIVGKYGNGEDRKKALGSRYAEVQARVNEILTGNKPAPAPTPTVDILTLVKKTIRGDFGNGDVRRKALGSNYAEVQRQVNLNYQNGTTNWNNIKLY
jgi:N-acetyl-anhydromuramyl-L-alanine amidase AmpD